VRLVSGDNLETAIATAVKAGIITDEEAKSQNACMTGEEFRTKVGGVVKDKEGNFLLEKNSNFNSIAK
jgi:magnesium-transporting ATPase (P-type)